MVRAAYSLDVALGQLNALAPNRSKLSDGGIGDAAHAARLSDHNPDETGVYHARDYTHDPAHGADMALYTRRLIADPRAEYVIFNDQFYDKDAQGRIRVRAYPLVNPQRTNKHDKHLHLSVKYGALGDDGRQWEAFTQSYTPPVVVPPAPVAVPKRPTIQEGSKGQAVWDLQNKLTRSYPAYSKWKPTGFFGSLTKASVIEFQRRTGLTRDGIVGPITWRALGMW